METPSTYLVLKELHGNPPPQWNAIQGALVPHVDGIVVAWAMVWVAMALFMLRYVLRSYRVHRKNHKH